MEIEEKKMENKGIILIVICALVLGSLPGCSKNYVPVPPTATEEATLEPTETPVPSTPTSIPPTITPTPVPPTQTPIPPTITPTPIVISVLSKSPELILASDMPKRPTSLPRHVVYTLPDMDQVLVAHELVFYTPENPLRDALAVDIYYPPNYQFGTKLPIVILSHGFGDVPNDLDKDLWQHKDWAKLIAASGMIAVSAQAGMEPVKNSYRLLEFLAENEDFLGVDLSRIGFWACSGQGWPVFDALKDKNSPYRDAFKAAAFYYLDLIGVDPSTWPPNLSLFVVRAGKDEAMSSDAMDNVVSKARSINMPVEYIVLEDAPHGFDVFQDNQVNKDTVQQTLEFFKSNLLPQD
jgi:hypothetical protein